MKWQGWGMERGRGLDSPREKLSIQKTNITTSLNANILYNNAKIKKKAHGNQPKKKKKKTRQSLSKL